jgi:predicted nucleic acid-binding protein
LPEGKRRSALEAEAMSLFGQLACLAVPEAAADQYASIKWETERKGPPLDENDLWIAATARALEAIVVTTDSDFQRVSGLQTEDWTRCHGLGSALLSECIKNLGCRASLRRETETPVVW